MNTQYIETLIIGAGQAGLSTGYHLKRRGRRLLIVDANARIGDNWRQQWDTLRLYTPAKYDGLPGLPFPAARWHCPQKDEVGDYLERYALHFDLPVRTNTRVERLEARPEGGYLATVGDETISCDNVVVATGTFGRTPNVPGVRRRARPVDPAVALQPVPAARPAATRARPGGRRLPLRAGHRLRARRVPADDPVRPSRGNIPFRPESRRAHVLMPVAVFVFKHVLTRRTPMGRKEMHEVRFHGGPAFRVKQDDLDRRGVVRNQARMTAVADGRPQLGDGTVLDVTNVVWCTGFRQVFDWIRLPILDEHGWPVEYRGVVDAAPGLYFCGLSFQYAFSSMVFPGISRDADYVARQIVARSATANPGRRLMAGHAVRFTRRVRDGRGRGADPGPRGLRPPRVAGGVRRVVRRRPG